MEEIYSIPNTTGKKRYYLFIDLQNRIVRSIVVEQDKKNDQKIIDSNLLLSSTECEKYVNPNIYFIVRASELLSEYEGWERIEGNLNINI